MPSSRVVDYLLEEAWALEPGVFSRLVQVVSRHAAGVKLATEEVEQITEARDKRESDKGRARVRPYAVQDGVAVIPISGVIARHASQVNGESQPRGTSVEALSGALRMAVADSDVQAILFDVDSPGGAVSGVSELADEIFEARATKPVHAIADGMMASAAYWLSSQANKVWSTKGSQVGSIGVIATVVDDSVAAHNEGIKIHHVTSAPAKAAGGKPGVAVTASDLAEIQDRVMEIHDLFVDAVARGRGIEREKAVAMGDGRVRLGAKARTAGFVDEVATFAQVMSAIRESATGAADGNSGREAAHTSKGVEPMATDKGATAPTAGLQAADVTTAQQSARADAPDLFALINAMDPSAFATAFAKRAPAHYAHVSNEGARGERERITQINSLAHTGQEAMRDQLVNSGASVPEAAVQLLKDTKTNDKIGRLEALRAAAKPVGQTEGLVLERPKAAATTDPAELAKQEFASNERVREMFDAAEKWQLFKARKPEAAAALLAQGVIK